MRRIALFAFALVLGGCAPPATLDAPAVASAMRRLESRIAVLEAQVSDHPRLPDGTVKERVASLRQGANDLEKAELARRRGDRAQAASLFEDAVEEVGADELVDVEPLYHRVRAPETSAPELAESAPPVTPAPAPADPPPPVAAPHPSAPHGHERASLSGAIRLDGPFAGEGGMGVVMLGPVGTRWTVRPHRGAVEQRRKEFVPHVLAVPAGSTVGFPNSDPVYHNVFSLSDTKRFDLGLYKGGQSKDVTFTHAGVVRVLCNLHAAMNAYIVVHDEPLAVVTDRGGRFHFRDLPPGRYRLRAWNERAREMVTREVELAPGPNRLYVPMRADQAPGLGPNKEGKPRGPKTHS